MPMPRLPQPPQGFDPRLLAAMRDDRFCGDVTSLSSAPFAASSPVQSFLPIYHKPHTPQHFAPPHIPQPPPRTPDRTSNLDYGFLTPERTPTTNKPFNHNQPAAVRSAPPKNHSRQPAAVQRPPRQDPPIQTNLPETTLEAPCPEETLEETLLRLLQAEIQELDRAEEERRQRLAPMGECSIAMPRDEELMRSIEEEFTEQLKRARTGAREDLNSDVYHAYRDSTGFVYHDITLTRVDLASNTNERVALSIYETDFRPRNYVTVATFHGPGAACRSEWLATGADYTKAFLAFRRAFKQYTRLSWEARAVPPEHVARHVGAWEAQRREQLLFDKFGEQPAGGGGGGGKLAKRRPEGVLTHEERESCRIKRFQYQPPPAHKPQGDMPSLLPGRYPVVPGDEPGDGGWTLSVSYIHRA